MEEQQRKIAKKIRESWGIPYSTKTDWYTDECLLKATEGTFFRASIELSLALKDLRSEIMKTWVGKIICWLACKLQRRKA